MPYTSMDRVRRRLFDATGDDATTEKSVVAATHSGDSVSAHVSSSTPEAGNPCSAVRPSSACPQTSAGSAADENTHEVKARSTAVNILIITDFRDAEGLRCFSESATYHISSVNIMHCLPERACRHCNSIMYQLIVTDIHLPTSCEILKTIYEIRRNSVFNQWTPVVAVHQDSDQQLNVANLNAFGINDVRYGKLTRDDVGDILSSLIADSHRSTPQNTNSGSTCHFGEVASPSFSAQAKSLHGKATSVPLKLSSEESTEISLTYNQKTGLLQIESDANIDGVGTNSDVMTSSSKVRLEEGTKVPLEQRAPSQNPAPQTSCAGKTSTNLTSKSTPPAKSAKQLVKPRVASPRNKPEPFKVPAVYSKLLQNTSIPHGVATPMFSSTQATTTVPRSFSYHPTLNPMLTLSGNVPYMVSGMPGTAGMKITLIPEDSARHSTKERLRRERIKACCEQLRRMMPKTIDASRRLDMATVLELAVMYIRIFQSHMPTVLQEQTNQLFQYLQLQAYEKKKNSTETQANDVAAANPSKYLKRQDGGKLSTGLSDSSAQSAFSSSQNLFGLAGSHNHNCSVSMNVVHPSVLSYSSATQATASGQGIQQSIHYTEPTVAIDPYIHNNNVPYYGNVPYFSNVESYNYMSSTGYESTVAYQHQLAHHIQQAASQKDALFNDVQLSPASVRQPGASDAHFDDGTRSLHVPV